MTVWYPPCIPHSHPHRITSTKCRINTAVSPDDGHSYLKHVEIDKLSVKKQGIADRPVYIKVIFRKICPILYPIPKLFRGNLARNVLSNFAKKLTHVYFAASQYGIYTDIVTIWTTENKKGWGKKFVTIKLWQMSLVQSQITLSDHYSIVCFRHKVKKSQTVCIKMAYHRSVSR